MSNKPYVIGIAGGSASGKTTITGLLAERLKDHSVLELHMDAYFLPPEQRAMVNAPFTGIAYRDDNHPHSFDLAGLVRDIDAAVNGNTHQVVLIEGLLTLAVPEVYERLDLKLFIDCRADERIVRRLRRNMATRGLSFDEIAEVYLDMVRYRHDEYVEPSRWRADLVINGSIPSEKSLDLLAEHIRLACDK